MALGETVYAVLSMVESHDDEAVQRAMGGNKNSPDIIKAFTRRCVLDASNLANSKSDLERSNGRCPGCDNILLKRPCKHELHLFG